MTIQIEVIDYKLTKDFKNKGGRERTLRPKSSTYLEPVKL